MNSSPSDPAQMRRWIYGILITIAFAMACGRIISVQRVYEPAFHRDLKKDGDGRPLWPEARPEPMPTFGSNDRSRWATIRALVHDGTYVVGKRDQDVAVKTAVMQIGTMDPMQAAVVAQVGYQQRVTSQSGIIFSDGWQTIDCVLHPETWDYYSSKPPLLSTILACLYWVMHSLFGWSLATHPATVVRAMLILVNALPFMGYLWLLVRIAETWGKSDWGKIYIVAAGAFATTVTPFLITLNNHTIGTFSIMVAWYQTLEIWRCLKERSQMPILGFAAAGFFASFAVTCELPALSFAVAIFALLLWWSPVRTLLLFVPMALVPAIAFFATNYAAIGMWKPAYAEFKGPWYQYEGSHWKILPPELSKKGIDFAKNVESRGEYALHVLVGHHGLFSLNPIWILALIGMIAGSWRIRDIWRQALFRGTDAEATSDPFPWFVQPLGLLLTIVVTGFYIQDDSANYGGFTNGLRWLMWLTPLWLTCLLPVADWLAERCTTRWLGGALLGVSIFSMCYQLWSPWRHPWIYDFMMELGWSGY